VVVPEALGTAGRHQGAGVAFAGGHRDDPAGEAGDVLGRGDLLVGDVTGAVRGPPALHAPGRGHGAGVEAAGGGDVHTAGEADDRHGRPPVGVCAVAEPAVLVVAPAPHAAVAHDRAAVERADPDGDDPAGEADDVDRRVLVDVGAVPDASEAVASPALDAPSG